MFFTLKYNNIENLPCAGSNSPLCIAVVVDVHYLNISSMLLFMHAESLYTGD